MQTSFSRTQVPFLSWSAKKRLFGFLGVGILFLLNFMALDVQVFAQGIQQFVGHVADSSGAAIPGATVTIRNEATSVDVVVKTTQVGDYTAPYVKPGIYTITVNAAGFKVVNKTHVQLDVDQSSKIDFTLPVGNVSETVTVNTDSQQIELSKADRGEVIEAERIKEMPLDGRQVLDLFQLSPGAVQANNPTYNRIQDNVSQNLQANGVTINAVAINIDGSTNDGSGNYEAYNPPLDSVGEFKVVLNAYDASYGRSAGAAIDLSLKSGTNKIHGTVYEYARRQYLDANTWIYDYSKAGLKVNHSRDNFGVQLDGPVYIPHLYNGKDRTFFMLQWDQTYENSPSTTPTINSIPNPQWLTGNFAGAQYWDSTTQSLMPLTIYDPLSPLTTFVDVDGKTKTQHSAFPGNIIPSNRIDSVGAGLFQYYNGIKPNYNPGPGYAPWQNNYYWIQVQTFTGRNGVFKLDQNFGQHDRATLSWGGVEIYNITNPNGIPADNPANGIASQVQPSEMRFGLEEIHTFTPNLILDNRVAVNTYKQGLTYGTRGNYLSDLGFSSNFKNNVFVNNMIPYVSTTSNLGGNSFIALSANTPGRHNIGHQLAYQPSVTYIRGRHSIRAGVDMRLLQYTTTQPNGQNWPNNQFNFTATWTGQLGPGYSYAPGLTAGNPIASLLLGDPSTGTTGVNIAPFFSQHYVAFWGEDDWKLTPKLTLNLGIRYDLLGARTERHNKLNGYFDTTATNPYGTGGITFAGVNGVPRGAYSMNLLNIQPRFGLAYAFTPRTSLRAGFGEFFANDESINGNSGFSSNTAYNNSLDNGITPYGHLSDPYPSFIQPTGTSLGTATNIGNSQSFINPNLKIPSIWSSSVSVEQQLTSRDILDISYSSTRAYNLPGSDDLNHVSAAYNAQCDADRGSPNRVLYCDGSSAPAKVANPFAGVAAFSGTSVSNNATISAGQLTRPLLAFSSVTENNLPLVHSWYNSMQVVASHNASKDLTFHFALTWSKNMQAGNIIDTVNRIYGRNLMSNDIPIAITMSGVYYLPVGRGRAFLGHTNRLVDAVVGGWEVSPLYVYHQGNPWNPNPSTPGQNFRILAPLYVHQHDLPYDSTHAYKRLQGVNPCVGYEDQDTPGLIHPGPSYTASNCNSYAIIRTASAYSVAQNIIYSGVRLPATHEFDVSVSKRFAWNERANLQLRLDALNVLNHPNWSQVGGTGSYGFSTDPTNVNWGTIQKGPQGPANAARELQISGKLNF
jgi:Carboxypeptidase regulatory-like domain/TonB dependent receptor